MSRRRVIPLAVALLLAVPAAMPMEAANKEHQQMMADLRMLQIQTQQLQAQLVALNDVLKTVTARLDEQAGVSRKSFADSKIQVDTLAGDVRVLREKADETNVRLSSISQEVDAIRQAQTALQQQAQAAAAVPPDPNAPAPAATPAPSPVSPVTPDSMNVGISPQQLFRAARSDYYAQNWSLAIQGFESYIKTFPKSDLADDAQYYIGETLLLSGKPREAVAAYDRVIAAYPASNTLPDAYYKRGMAYTSLGQAAQARESFEFVVKSYADSDAARLSKQALDRLNQVPR